MSSSNGAVSGGSPRVLPSTSLTADRAEGLVVEYREVFAYFDGDFDGVLTTAEFTSAIRALGHTPTETQMTALSKTVERIYPTGLSSPELPLCDPAHLRRNLLYGFML